jgi:transcriptional regulator NrdR family protein
MVKKKTITKNKRKIRKSSIKCNHIVKRRGRVEEYDEKKVYASIYSAALNSHYKEKEAENLAEQVMKKVNKWINAKGVVKSDDIKNQILRNIKDKEVALMYNHHLDIC